MESRQSKSITPAQIEIKTMDIYDTPLTEMEKLEQLEEDARQKRIDYLRKKGWKHSSSYPGCLWLWENEKLNIRGCNFSTAWSIEQHS